MTVDKNTLTSRYFSLAKKLESVYPKLQFRDHCFWRIALDNTLKGKWDEVIDRPAYKHLSKQQLEQVVHWMERYEKDERLLQLHNTRSISFRKAR
ncbi:MAG: hypothetical protein AAGA85_13575, partial [Bacteroidota bacterium]